MRSNTGCVLKAATTGFTVRPEVGYERNHGVKDDSKAFSLSNWRNGVTTTEMGKLRMKRQEKSNQKFAFRCVWRRTDSLEKTLMLGKIEGQRRRG